MYEQAIKRAKAMIQVAANQEEIYNSVITIFPELRESEDERVRKALVELISTYLREHENGKIHGVYAKDILVWLEKQGKPKEINPSEFDSQLNRLLGQFKSLPKEELASSLSFYLNVVQNDGTYKEEKQGEQKPCMIQWKGDNLKEVIDFTGKDKNFDKWFESFEDYEKFVREHEGVLKLFNEDGSHYEVPVGAWIVKTPDGRNVASKAVLKTEACLE